MVKQKKGISIDEIADAWMLNWEMESAYEKKFMELKEKNQDPNRWPKSKDAIDFEINPLQKKYKRAENNLFNKVLAGNDQFSEELRAYKKAAIRYLVSDIREKIPIRIFTEEQLKIMAFWAKVLKTKNPNIEHISKQLVTRLSESDFVGQGDKRKEGQRDKEKKSEDNSKSQINTVLKKLEFNKAVLNRKHSIYDIFEIISSNYSGWDYIRSYVDGPYPAPYCRPLPSNWNDWINCGNISEVSISANDMQPGTHFWDFAYIRARVKKKEDYGFVNGYFSFNTEISVPHMGLFKVDGLTSTMDMSPGIGDTATNADYWRLLYSHRVEVIHKRPDNTERLLTPDPWEQRSILQTYYRPSLDFDDYQYAGQHRGIWVERLPGAVHSPWDTREDTEQRQELFGWLRPTRTIISGLETPIFTGPCTLKIREIVHNSLLVSKKGDACASISLISGYKLPLDFVGITKIDFQAKKVFPATSNTMNNP